MSAGTVRARSVETIGKPRSPRQNRTIGRSRLRLADDVAAGKAGRHKDQRLTKTAVPIVEQVFGLTIPRTLEEVSDPTGIALIVYDMQVGIVSQLPDGVTLRKAGEADLV